MYTPGCSVRRSFPSYQLADYFILTTAEETKERGFTVTHISNIALGESSDAGLTLTKELVDENWAGDEFKEVYRDTQNEWQKYQLLRQRIDNDRSVTAAEVFTQIGQFINTFTTLPLMAFNPASHLEGAIYNNLIIKQAVWEVSEYSGRERANVSTAISFYCLATHSISCLWRSCWGIDLSSEYPY